MGPLLELLTAVLVLVDSTKDRDDLLLGGKRDGSADLCASLPDGLDDLRCALVDQLMVICLQRDSHDLVCHKKVASIRTFQYDKR